MRLGLFIDPIGTEDDPRGFKYAAALKEAGYEFMELCVPAYGGISDEEFEQFEAKVKACPLPAEAANCLFPGIYVLIEHDKAIDWFKKVCVRSQRLGIKTLVFGSGGARNIPGGWTEEQAHEKMVALLKRMGPIAAEYDITVVIEPLEKPATNFINETHTGAKLVRATNHPNIRLLVDYFHYVREKDTLLAEKVPLFAHIHCADPVTRTCQTEITEDFKNFLNFLKEHGWDGNLSIESGKGDLSLEQYVSDILNFPKLLGVK